MGYQESFVHTTKSNIERNNADLEKMLEIFKKHDVRCKGDWLASCVAKITFKKTVGPYKKGMQVLWITGERQAQRSGYRLFDLYPEDDDYNPDIYTKEEYKIINRAKLTFIDDILYLLDDITEDSDKVDIEHLELQPKLPSNHDNLKSLSEDIDNALLKYVTDRGITYSDPEESCIHHYPPRPKVINEKYTLDNLYKYYPSNKEEAQDVMKIIENVCTSHGFDFSIKEEVDIIHTGDKRFDYNMYINDVYIGCISYLTWCNEYTFNLFELKGQSLREVCKKLLEKDESR